MIDGARRARIGVSMVFAVCGASFATWTSRVSDAQRRVGLSTGQLAIALFVLATGSVVMLAVTGVLIARIGSRRGAVAGLTALTGGLVLVAFAPSLVAFCAALFVLGAGNSLLDVSMNAHAARVESAYGRPIFAGFHAFWNIGGLVGSGLAALLGQANVPIGDHFTGTAVVLFGVGLVAIRSCFFRTPDVDQQGPALVLPSRALLPLGVVAFCGFLAEGTVNDWSTVDLSSVDLSRTTVPHSGIAPLGYFAFSIAMILVRLVADRLAARWGAVRVLRVAAVVAALGFLLVAAITIPVVGVVGFGVVGFGVAAVVPLAWSAAAKVAPDSSGQSISAVAACGYLGFLVGPVVVGAIASTVGLRLALVSVLGLVAVSYALAGSVRTRVRA